MSCNFNATYDPLKDAVDNYNIDKSFFNALDTSSNDELFKLCAKDTIDSSNPMMDDARIKTSVKYQVLCNETSFIGIKKNK